MSSLHTALPLGQQAQVALGSSSAPVVTGRGRYVPEPVLTNRDVAAVADPDRLAAWVRESKWCSERLAELREAPETRAHPEDALHRTVFEQYISERIGIQARRVVDRDAILERRPSRRGELGSDLGARAAQLALADAGVDAAEIDLIVCGTSTPDGIYPATAIEIQSKIGAHHAYGFDLLAACSSFVYGLDVVRGLLLAGQYRRALVISAEFFSCGVDYADPTSSFFWGDAAAAVVVEAGGLAQAKSGYEILATNCRSQLSRNIRTGLGGTRSFLAMQAEGFDKEVPGAPEYPFFFQNGHLVYREVVPLVSRAVTALLEERQLCLDDIRVFMFHQASTLMIEGIKKRLFREAPAADRVPLNLPRYGNTSSCGVALCLAEDQVLQPGELACMTAFGAGYTVGSVLLRRVAA